MDDSKSVMEVVNLGYFGNVWIRMQRYPKKDVENLGHKHNHDHMSLLVKGGLRVEVDGKETFEVWASGDYKVPTFFEVPAEHNHKLIPLEDDTIAYCVFAMRDNEGELVDHYRDSDHYQYGVVIKK